MIFSDLEELIFIVASHYEQGWSRAQVIQGIIEKGWSRSFAEWYAREAEYEGFQMKVILPATPIAELFVSKRTRSVAAHEPAA